MRILKIIVLICIPLYNLAALPQTFRWKKVRTSALGKAIKINHPEIYEFLNKGKSVIKLDMDTVKSFKHIKYGKSNIYTWSLETPGFRDQRGGENLEIFATLYPGGYREMKVIYQKGSIIRKNTLRKELTCKKPVKKGEFLGKLSICQNIEESLLLVWGS